LLYVSEGARALYGKSTEELSDDPDYIFRVCHADDELFVRSAIDNAARGGGLLQLEHRIVIPGAEERWIRIEAALERLADASIIWHGYIRDITSRKREDAERADMVARLHLAAKAHGLGMWDCVIATNRLTYDARLYEIYDGTQEEFPNPWDLWLARVHPDDKQRLKDETATLIQLAHSDAEIFLTEFRLRMPNGVVKRIRSRGAVERDAQGQAVRIVGINWDRGTESDFADVPMQQFTVLKHWQKPQEDDAESVDASNRR